MLIQKKACRVLNFEGKYESSKPLMLEIMILNVYQIINVSRFNTYASF